MYTSSVTINSFVTSFPLVHSSIQQDLHFYAISPDGLPFRSYFEEPRYSAKDIGLGYRMINYWKEKGLIDDHQKGEGEWHRFSFLDLVWINIMIQLRDFGLCTEKIRKVKKKLYITNKDGNEMKLLRLAVHVLRNLDGSDQIVLVTSDGDAIITEQESLNYLANKERAVHHVTIYLRKILQDDLGINISLIQSKNSLKRTINDKNDFEVILELAKSDTSEIRLLPKSGNETLINIKESQGSRINAIRKIRKLLREVRIDKVIISKKGGQKITKDYV